MTIHYLTEKRDLKPKEGENLLELCLRSQIPVSHSCEGMASCGTCRVIIIDSSGNLEPRDLLEQDMADDRGFQENERLACQLTCQQSFRFKLPEDP